MKKNKHPKILKTNIILSDGSHIKLNWIFFKKTLKIENDFLNNALWLQKKKFFKQAR